METFTEAKGVLSGIVHLPLNLRLLSPSSLALTLTTLSPLAAPPATRSKAAEEDLRVLRLATDSAAVAEVDQCAVSRINR